MDPRFAAAVLRFAATGRTPALLWRAASVFLPLQASALALGAARRAVARRGRNSGGADPPSSSGGGTGGGAAAGASSGEEERKTTAGGLGHRLRHACGSLLRSCCFLASFYQLPMLVAGLYPTVASCAVSLPPPAGTTAALPLPAAAAPPPHNTRRLSHGIALGGVLGGLGMLVERPSRKNIIVSLCACYAGVSAGRELADVRGWPRRGQRRGRTVMDVLAFGAALAVMLRFHEQQPAALVRWLCGYDPAHTTEDLPTHKPMRTHTVND